MTYGGTNSELNRANGNIAYESLLDELSMDGKNGKSDGKHNCLAISNWYLYNFLLKITRNTVDEQRSPLDLMESDANNIYIFEFIIAWLIRLLNCRCWVLPLVFLSIWAWKSRIAKPFWIFCCKIRLIHMTPQKLFYLTWDIECH